MKTGLVMEGGAMRGLFTAGVIDVMMENGIDFDGTVGVSSGAAFGCNYKSRQPGRVIRYNIRFAKEPKFCSFRSWLKTGDLYGAEFCYHTMPHELDYWDVETFAADPQEFWIVCTDVKTGKPVYYQCKTGDEKELDLIRASASMPFFSKPVEIGNRQLLDGGISDSIPLRFFQYRGYDKNVVILTQPEGYFKRPSKASPLLPIALHKYPAIARRLRQRYKMYNRQLAYVLEEEQKGTAFVIRPPHTLQIGKIEHDPNVMHSVYEIGRNTAMEQLEELKKFLGE